MLRGEVGARALRVRSVSREGAWASAGVQGACPRLRLATMYYPASTGPCKDGDTAPFAVAGSGEEDLGFVSFTKEFKHLGSIVHSSRVSLSQLNPNTRISAAFPSPGPGIQGKTLPANSALVGVDYAGGRCAAYHRAAY